MGVRAPTDKRFRRSRVRPARRRRDWKLRWKNAFRAGVVLSLVGYAAYRAAHLVLNASTLSIDRVEVQGNTRLSTGEVLALVDGLRGQNILTARLREWRSRLMASPWVKDAALRKVMPSTVEIVVSERIPVGLGRAGSRLYLVDERGGVIDEYGPQYADFDLPIIDGLIELVEGGPPTIDGARATLARRLLADLSDQPDLARRVSQLDVTDPHNVVVLLDGDGARLYLGNERFADRLHAYLEMAAALRERVPDIDYVDLRFGERVYVGPTGSEATVPASP